MSTTTDSLFKALGLFIEAFRPYAISMLSATVGDKWPAAYAECLTATQREAWDKGLRNNTPAEQLIDFGNLKSFVLRYRDLLKTDFGRNTNNVASWLDDITEARNKCNHYNADLTDDDARRAFDNMVRIADKTGMTELRESLKRLQIVEPVQTDQSATAPASAPVTDESPALTPIQTTGPAPGMPYHQRTGSVGPIQAGPQPWFGVVHPHQDIRQGNLDESVFAANLADVSLDRGPEVYRNAALFFEKTFPTAGLRTVAGRVIRGLNGGQDAENRVMSLQTGFGGGKTHTLIALFHLARMGKRALDFESSRTFLAQITEPTFSRATIAVFTNTTNDPTQGRITGDGLTIRTLWGEIAYQLGGRAAYELIRLNDESRSAPKGRFREVLALTQPALILIDELADYGVAASAVSVGSSTLADQTISFLQELTEAVAGSSQCVLVTTLPASVTEVASSPLAATILSTIEARMGRVGADTKPVADDEIYEVVRRRLFEDLGDEATRDAVISAYLKQYRQMSGELPTSATQSSYRTLLEQAYPFHPTLMEVFHKRWASHGDFQRTRGVLRLLGSIVSDLWKRQGALVGNHWLIHPSDVDFGNLDALTGLIKKLYGNGYDAVLPADVTGSGSNAGHLDAERPDFGRFRLTQGVAATILLNSFGITGPRQGIGLDELKLAVMKPQSFNHNDVNAVLDALEANAYYLYYNSSGTGPKRYWFFTKPNLNILINHARHDIGSGLVQQEIIRRLESYKSAISLFNTLINPSDDIPEQTKPTLVIVGPDKAATPDGVSPATQTYIERVATKRGNNERIHRNTILFLLPAQAGLGKLSDCVTAYLAGQVVTKEYGNQLDTEQRTDLRRRTEEANGQVGKALAATYSIVAKYSAKRGIEKVESSQFKDLLDQQVNAVLLPLLKEGTEVISVLDKVGLSVLERAGLLPTTTQPVRTKDVYETFLRYDDKPMVSGPPAIGESLLRYCQNGEFAIGAGDGKLFRRTYYKEPVPQFDVLDETYWLLDSTLHQSAAPVVPIVGGENPALPGSPVFGEPERGLSGNGTSGVVSSTAPGPRRIKTVVVSGRVDIANYSQVFQTFIMPLAQNSVEIEIKIKGKSTTARPLTETSPEYRIIIEGAQQLGLSVEEE